MYLSQENLKEILEAIYLKYNRSSYIGSDPLIFAYDYQNPRDIEIAAFVASTLSYGRVAQIQASLKKLFEIMGKSPYDFIVSFDNRTAKKLSSFKHRFNTGEDMAELFSMLKHCLQQSGSLEEYFCKFYSDTDDNIIPALGNFCGALLTQHSEAAKKPPSRGLKYLLANPAGKSPCKRLNMFLRWVVRDDGVDLGLWKKIPPSKLIVPLDTHMIRLCKILGLHNSKTPSLATAVAVSNEFKKLSPTDPVRYDFALCRIGIVEGCNGVFNKDCGECELSPLCRHLKN